MLKQINKIIQKKIEREMFLHEVTLDVDSDYFIQEIEKKLAEKNLSYRTNVEGKMTTWNAFVDNPNFIQVLKCGLDALTNHIEYEHVYLSNAWGIRIDKNDYTKLHDHASSMYSGILYLNDVNQKLVFPELNMSITPRKGTFVSFSAWLKHKADPNQGETKYAIPFNLNPAQHKSFKPD
tara:strand:- start:36 stop:572 length:537 start_codon:yes stop_codon:yes gene_type:complete